MNTITIRHHLRAHSYGHDLTRELQLIGFNLNKAGVQLGVSLS
jgi:hypothetical protein